MTAAPDQDEYGGVYCQTELDLSMLSLLTVEDETLLRGEPNRLTQENQELKLEKINWQAGKCLWNL